MKPITNPAVARAFEAYPPNMRRKLLALRELILETAAATEGVGELDEALKWGEPAFLTAESGSGSTVRIDWKASKPDQYAMYFNCQTTLVETFKTLFPREFNYEGNRAIVFKESAPIPQDALAFCVAAALTYHRSGKAKRAGKAGAGKPRMRPNPSVERTSTGMALGPRSYPGYRSASRAKRHPGSGPLTSNVRRQKKAAPSLFPTPDIPHSSRLR